MAHQRTAELPEDSRFCQARLQLLINTLPVTTYFNPLGVAISGAAMYAARAELGAQPLSHIMLGVGAQCLAGAGAFAVWRRHPRVDAGNMEQVRRELIGLQAIISLAWAIVGWTFWLEGNPANNAYVAIIMSMALWAMALTRCAVRTVFLTGVGCVAVPLVALYASSSGVLAHVFLILSPLWLWYMIFSGMAARQKVDDMLKARFAHEDLSRELAAARDEAVQKRVEAESANELKTAFLANMSHELRTPLNAIIGFSEIISSQALGSNNPRYPEYAGDIHSSGTHLLTLINEILDVAKIEAGRMEIDPRPLDLQYALDGVERIMAIRIQEKGLQSSFTVASDVPNVQADEKAFRQILLNLLSNAVKFTPEGGRIDILCCAAEDGGLLVSVSDSGAGIPADKLAMLFKPFAQVDNRFDHSHGGTGLGLALVQGLARLHGGHAWIESEVGHGTTVYVYFPLEVVKRELTYAAQ